MHVHTLSVYLTHSAVQHSHSHPNSHLSTYPLTGVSSDPQLALGAGASNRVMWANGGDWPSIHSSGNYGFTDVSWTDGTCSGIKDKEFDWANPYIVWALVGLVLLLNNASFSPFEKGGCCEFIRLGKLHPHAVSGIVGDLPAWALGLDKKHVSSYSLGSFIVILAYILINVLVYLGNALGEEGFVKASGITAIMNMWLALLPTAKTST